MAFRVAVVAAACEFPEGRTPEELWSTVLHSRRCFRTIPDERLAMAEYAGAESDPDGIYPIEAALLEGYRFDRDRFRIPQSAFERTDMAHWLALDVATRALASLSDAGIAAERDSMAVIVANTLTGEFSRANALRYRWPYVERSIRSAAQDVMPGQDVTALVAAAESAYKAPLPAPDEDSLAGGLANTIAGRIANYHGLRGGAHTVDGACASSLVAVTSAYERLAFGDAGCALVGAVDLSLDPFELVGFARNGALARGLMRVFDQQSDGFWPGEGCGFVMLATEHVAARHGWPILAWIRGAAMSTDGEGALTRPNVEGQTLAARRAWARAGRDPAEADYFEAHGTGTPTGDPVELAGLAALLGDVVPARPIPVGSIKANIGHTKAAAGMAGLIKAISICQQRIIPATTGCMRPHPILDGAVGERLAVRAAAQPVAHRNPVSAGVNSFGFGGVNCHVVIEGVAPAADFETAALPAEAPHEIGAELFQLAARSADELALQLQQLRRRAHRLSRAQLPDLAHALDPGDAPAWRACVVARTPQELASGAAAAAADLRSAGGAKRRLGQQFSWSAPADGVPAIGFLFSGQGSTLRLLPLQWAARFATLQDSACTADKLARQDIADTAVLQPLLAEVAIAGLQLLDNFGVDADVVLGHSFGELPALYASGRLDRDALRALAAERGACMRDHSPGGAMLAVRAPRDFAYALADRHRLDVACENGALRFVLAGDTGGIAAAAAECAARNIPAGLVPTLHPFHSRGMGAARAAFGRFAADVRWQPGRRKMVSSITGRVMDDSEPVAELLARQVTDTVKFAQALEQLGELDLVLEVGAGAVLGGLMEERYRERVMPLDIFSDSAAALLAALGSAWVCGAALKRAALYEGRQLLACALDEQPVFLHNPCGLPNGAASAIGQPSPVARASGAAVAAVASPQASSLDTLRAVVADVTGLSALRLEGHLRLLADLHLNSIRARHAVAVAAQRLGIAKMPFELARFANASLEEAAAYLEGLRRAEADSVEATAAGMAPWLRCFTHEWRAGAPAPASALPRAALLDDRLAPLSAACHALLAPHGGGQPRCAILLLPSTACGMVSGALLDAAQRLLGSEEIDGLLVLQGAQLANGFLRSVAAELPRRRFCAVEYESLDVAALAAALAEYDRDSCGYSELRMRGAGVQRRAVALAALPAAANPWTPRPGAVLLVTGGARGIGAPSARALAQSYGCRLALVGRSGEGHAEVAQTLAGMRADALDVCYFQADLADPLQACAAVAAIESRMGPVRAVLHAAGINRPAAMGSLDARELAATIAGKVDTLQTLLDCLPTGQLELVVGYGSIIGELGLAGDAHYALANEWLGNRLEQLRRAAPSCRVVQLSWSAWREVGMAARLDGVLEALVHAGTRPLDTDEAVAAMLCAVQALPPSALIVSGRYGRRLDGDADLRLLQPHRYLERPLVLYPGVELIAEAELSSDTDLYLRDHAPFGIPLFPLACAIEAMVSAAECLHPAASMPVMDALRVGEAIACSLGQRFLLRTSALAMQDGTVMVELRAQTTAYEVAHFAAVFSWPGPLPTDRSLAVDGSDAFPAADLLYQGLCFHGPRFRRLATVLRLGATGCQVRTARGEAGDWYGPLLPQGFAGGAPGVRDAVLHALQLCVPHHVVLPVAAAQVQLGLLDTDSEYLISARQTFSDGTRFVFDIEVSDTRGQVVERWLGLELMRGGAGAGRQAGPAALAPILLEPLIGRLMSDELGAGGAAVGLVAGPARAVATELALARALQSWPALQPMHVTATHAGALTIALASSEPRLALDLEFAPAYSIDEWRLMLGEQRMRFAMQLVTEKVATEADALLYAWTVSECLIKLGIGEWPLASAGRSRIDTAFIGPVLKFDCAQLCVVVAVLNLAGQPAAAALAIALAGVPAATDTRQMRREKQ